MMDIFKPFKKREVAETEADRAEIARQRSGRLVATVGLGAAMHALTRPTSADAQVLSTDERLALTGSVDVTEYLARDPSTPERRVSLYRQIVEGFGEEMERQGPATMHGRDGHRVFIKGNGRSAIMVDGYPAQTREGVPFMHRLSAYLQITDRTLAKLQTFDFEPDKSYVSVEIVVLGPNVVVDTPHIIDSGRTETPSQIFNRVPLLLSGQSTIAISATIDKKTGAITSCNAFVPIVNLPEEIQKYATHGLTTNPVQEIVFATEHPRVAETIPDKERARLIAEKMWQGIAMHFATGS